MSPVVEMVPRGNFFFCEKREFWREATDKKRKLAQEMRPGSRKTCRESKCGPSSSPNLIGSSYTSTLGGRRPRVCVRVTDVLREYLREYTVDVSSPGVRAPVFRPGAPLRRASVGRTSRFA